MYLPVRSSSCQQVILDKSIVYLWLKLKILFYQFQGSGGGKEVPLKEGEVTDIKIEVTSEDGTVKNYFIHAKRLSAKDAVLSGLELSVGELSPEFSSDITEYSCKLLCLRPQFLYPNLLEKWEIHSDNAVHPLICQFFFPEF